MKIIILSLIAFFYITAQSFAVTSVTIQDATGMNQGSKSNPIHVSFISGSGSSLFPSIPTTATIDSTGDSISIGAYASTNYPLLISKDINNNPPNNYGVSGQQACDMVTSQTFTSESPTNTYNPLYISMIGINDASISGIGAYEVNFNNCLESAISWVTIPSTYKVLGQTSTTTGTWVNSSNFTGSIGIYSSTNGSTASFSLNTYGLPIYAWYWLNDSDTGTFSLSLDGNLIGNYATKSVTPILTNNGGKTGIGFIRIPNVSTGTHTLLFTVTSSTGSSNIVEIEGVGTPSPYSYYGQPTLLQGGVTQEQNDNQSIATAEYNSDVFNDVNLLKSDGLNVTYVNTRNYLNDTTDMANQNHPNTTGQGHLRDAFESVIPLVSSSQWIGSASGNISYTNNVGIGTATAAFPLVVTGSVSNSFGNVSAQLMANTGAAGLALTSNGPSGKSYNIFTTDSSDPHGGGLFNIVDATNSVFKLTINGTNVGIGSYNPGAGFDDALNDAAFGQQGAERFHIGSAGRCMAWNRNPTNGVIDTSNGQAYQWCHNQSTTQALDYYYLNTISSGNSNIKADAFVVNATGNIGLGTVFPVAALDVNGTIRMASGGSANTGVCFCSDGKSFGHFTGGTVTSATCANANGTC